MAFAASRSGFRTRPGVPNTHADTLRHEQAMCSSPRATQLKLDLLELPVYVPVLLATLSLRSRYALAHRIPGSRTRHAVVSRALQPIRLSLGSRSQTLP